MTKTENYGLNQWESSDRVLMDDFNADNQNIEMALLTVQSSIPKVIFGTYTGTGTCGSSNPTGISVGFAPQIVFVFSSTGTRTVFARNGMSSVYTATSSNAAYKATLTWTGTGLSWYNSGTTDASDQLNGSGQTYYYFVVG